MVIKSLDSHIFTLDNFEGPLDFLFHLIQKNEIDIYNIPIQQITAQYQEYISELLDPSVESGAEFIGLTASLLWLKSKMLLPKHDQELIEEDDSSDSEFAIIHQLIEYCRFKEIAKTLSEREEKQHDFFARGADEPDDLHKKPLGLEHVSLQDLAHLFQDLLKKAATSKGLIEGEVWSVSDKIKQLKKMILMDQRISLLTLFLAEHCREEMIVTLLAILELMKLGEARIVKDLETNTIMIIARKENK